MGVEVVERALPEEDRVGERAEPRVEDDRLAARVGHRRLQRRRLDRVQLLRRAQRDRVAADLLARGKRRQRLRAVGAADAEVGVELEVPRRALRSRVGVHQHAVRARRGEVDRLGDAAVRRRSGGWRWMITPRSRRTTIRWMPVCGPGAALVVGQRRAGGLADRERERASGPGASDALRLEPGERVGPRRRRSGRRSGATRTSSRRRARRRSTRGESAPSAGRITTRRSGCQTVTLTARCR